MKRKLADSLHRVPNVVAAGPGRLKPRGAGKGSEELLGVSSLKIAPKSLKATSEKNPNSRLSYVQERTGICT